MLHKDRRRAQSFGADAEQYDRARPSYPKQLVDDLTADAPQSVLDVGCGTGKAGRLFVERGCVVTGVEPDARMAVVARRHGLDVEEGPFETWDPGDRRFDLLISAQAWHWVDPAAGAAKAADVLRAAGRIALFWNIGEHEPEVEVAFAEVYARLAPDVDDGSSGPGGWVQGAAGDAHADFIGASDRFGATEERTYTWEQRYTTADWLDHLPTHSNHRALPRDRLDDLLGAIGRVIDERGGTITSTFRTWLITARPH